MEGHGDSYMTYGTDAKQVDLDGPEMITYGVPGYFGKKEVSKGSFI